MKIYTETIKIASCDECPKAHNWDERCKVWGKMMNTTFNEPIPEDCPLPDGDNLECKPKPKKREAMKSQAINYLGRVMGGL